MVKATDMDPDGIKRHLKGIWFETSEGVDWGDGGLIELKASDGTTTFAMLQVEELFTGEDEVPSPQLIILPDRSSASFFDFKQWRHPIDR